MNNYGKNITNSHKITKYQKILITRDYDIYENGLEMGNRFY